MEQATACDKWNLPAGRRQHIEFPICKQSENISCCEICDRFRELVAKAVLRDDRYKEVNPRFSIPRQGNKKTILRLPRLSELGSQTKELTFSIYAHPDTPCPWNVLHPYRSLDLDFADDRLADCRQNHACFREHESQLPNLPTRVISVGDDASSIRLMESRGVQDRYICLSHCWGSKQPLVTTASNLEDHLNHIPWDAIPPLYQDTIRLAWRYGIKYVWIDSLCILQGDERDWAHEAGRMKDVYGNAFLTIAAASSPDCSSGILSESLDGHASFDESMFLHWEGTTTGGAFKWIVVSFDLLDYNTCYSCDPSFSYLPKSCLPTRCLSPLYTRAWVLQENLLSPRTLSFALYRLKWTCRDSIKSSDNHPNIDHGFPQGFNQLIQSITESPSKYQGYHWLELIQCYSKLKIAEQHDWLPALSGLAQIYQQTDPDSTYLAGIWDNWLLPSLTWRRAESGNMAETGTESLLLKPASPEKSEQSHWCTPSWSWASIGDAVVFDGNDQWAKSYTFLRGADCDPSTIHNPWGNVRHGKLEVSGPISAFGPDEQHRCELGHETECIYDCDVKYLAGKNIECLVLGLETSSYEKHGRHPNDLGSWNRQVSLSVKIFGLLLEPMDIDTATYRRVGLLRYYYEGRGPYAIDKSRRGVWWYQRTTDTFRRDITIV